MRKAFVVLAVAAALWPTAASAKHGNNGPNLIVGTRHADFLRGGHGPDVIKAKGGPDVVWTGKGGPGDEAYGGAGADKLHNFSSGNAPGLMDGGPGRDVCVGDRHDTFRSCEVVRYR